MKKIYYKYIHSLYLSKLSYAIATALIIGFLMAYVWSVIFPALKFLTLLFLFLMLIDYLLLYVGKTKLKAERILPVRLSNGDDNPVDIRISNRYPFKVFVKIIDEIPEQFQKRDFEIHSQIPAHSKFSTRYYLRPIIRGEYHFHDIHLLAKSPLRLVVRNITEPAQEMVKVYPAFLEARKFEMLAFTSRLTESGSRKIRKVGNSLEFEQIREYVTGDDIRAINWKATARSKQLMVNHFNDERSQSVYCLIDKGRVMKMPFNGMTLLDYSINSAVMLSRIILNKYDKAGLICFDHQEASIIPADRKKVQFSLINEALYNQQTDYKEPNYEKLYAQVIRKIRHRSLLILYTNFESLSSLKRQLPFIKGLAARHLVLLVFFENTEISGLINQPVNDIESLYIKIIAAKFNMEKRIIVKELRNHGIMTLLTKPEHLTVNAINKYLEIKARQAI